VSLVKPPSAPPEATTDAGEVRLARGVTLLDATLLGTGALLGGGVFVLLGLAAGLAGPAVLLALFLNGLITIPTLLVYAELGSASGEAGGGYRWIREGLGRQFGFFGGWLAWFSHAAACALYALAAAAFAAFIARSAGWLTPTPEAVQGLALALAGLFVALSYGGVKLGFRAQNAANLLVLVAVLVFVGFGIGEVLENPDRVRFNLDPFFPGGSTWSGLSGVLLAMGLTFIAFQGYELVAQTSEEIQDPRRNIPRAIWASFLAAWGLMLAVAFVALAGTSFVQGEQSWVYLAGARESALVEAAGRLMPAGAIAIAGAALLLQLTALNACLYSSSRVSFAMGRDGDLPRAFGRVHRERRFPHWALLGSGGLVLAMALLPLATVAFTADLLFLLLFLLVNVAYIKLRKTVPADRFGFRAPLFPAIPLLGIAGKAFLAVYLWRASPEAWLIAAAWMGLGVVVYTTSVRPRQAKEPAVAPRPAFAARPPDRERKGYRVLVLLSSPAPSTARSLARAAGAIAQGLDGEVLLLAPVIVPDATPLEEGRRRFQSGGLLTEARGAVPPGVPVHTLVRIGHSLDALVRAVVLEEGASLLVLSSVGQANVGQATGPLVALPPCDLALLRHRKESTAARILITGAGAAQAPLSVRLGTAMAKAAGGQAVLFHVQEPEEAPEAHAAWARDLLDHHAVAGAEAHLESPAAKDAVEAVVQRAADCDLVVVGASAPAWWSRSLLGWRAQEIADRAPANVLLVRRRVSGSNLGRRLVLLRRYFLPE
jgi:amino acid transporter/nucleotide-binding universal stress UspA family protein